MIIVKIADVEALPILNSLPELSSKWAGYVLNHPLNGPFTRWACPDNLLSERDRPIRSIGD